MKNKSLLFITMLISTVLLLAACGTDDTEKY